jgi:hypothetical protein
MCLLASGCAAFRTTTRHPLPPPPETATNHSPLTEFHAVYEGDLRIGFRRFQAIWYIAMTPGGSNLSAAVLNPIGIKIMQMQGNSSTQECRISVPNADRLKPYGEALFAGLLWAFADPGPSTVPPTGATTQFGPVTVVYTAQDAGGPLRRKTVSDEDRLAYTIDFDSVPGATQPALRILCQSPRCTLTLKPRTPRRP